MEEARMDNKTRFKWIMTLLLSASMLLIPESESITGDMKIFLALTLCAVLIFALELMDNTIPALILPFAYVLFGICDMGTALKSWTMNVPWMCLGGFILANVLDRIGLLKRIAYFCIIKTGGTYKGIMYGMMVAGIILGLFSAANVFLFAALGFGVCKAFELENSKAAAGIMLASGMAPLVPNCFIYKPSNFGILVGNAATVTDIQIGYGNYFIENLPFLPFAFIMVWVLTKLFKPEKDIQGKQYFIDQRAQLGPISKQEKKAAVALLLFSLFLVTASWHKLDLVYGFIFIATIFFMPGVNVGKPEDLKKVNYSFLIFVVGCMAIGQVANVVGVGKMISTTIVPYLADMSSVTFMGCIYVLGIVVNFLLTPLAAMATLGAPVSQIAVDLGANINAVLYSFNLGLDQVLFPYEHALYLVCFSYGLYPLKDFIKAFGAKMLLASVYLMVIVVPYWKLIGLI